MNNKSNPIIYEINRISVPEGIPKVYLDASFKDGVGSYAFIVQSKDGLYIESNLIPEEWAQEGPGACELYSAVMALNYCWKGKGYLAVGFYFDYVGIYTHIIKRAGEPKIFCEYSKLMTNMLKDMDVYFQKIDDNNDIKALADVVSKASVRLQLGGDSLGQYRRIISER